MNSEVQAVPCRILKVNHTGLTVSDMGRAVRFFREVLGFSATDPVRQSGPAVERITGVPGAVLDIVFCAGGGHTIELLQYVHPTSGRQYDLRHNDVGFAHISFEVDDINIASAAVRTAGFQLFDTPQRVPAGPRKGGWNVYAKDVGGICIELQQAPQRR